MDGGWMDDVYGDNDVVYDVVSIHKPIMPPEKCIAFVLKIVHCCANRFIL